MSERFGAGRGLVGALVAASILAGTSEARAFCRTTTCNEQDPEQTCLVDERGCMITGNPLYWRGRCMSFGVDHEGSTKRGISFDAARATIAQAYSAWMQADCGGGQTPSLEIFESPEPILCDHWEYNKDDGNSNAWVFYDENWPHPQNYIALTTLSFTPDGEIYDVDVEINSEYHELAVEPLPGQADFSSVCTHEAGHFFGLSHSQVLDATMEDRLPDDTSMRSLEEDDISGICTIYPADRETPACESTRTPRHGFSPECGDHSGANPDPNLSENAGCCSTAPGRGGGNGWLLLSAALGGLVLSRLRARKR